MDFRLYIRFFFNFYIQLIFFFKKNIFLFVEYLKVENFHACLSFISGEGEKTEKEIRASALAISVFDPLLIVVDGCFR